MRLQSTNALIQNKISAGREFGPCKTCIFVVLRIQKYNPDTHLASLCEDLFRLTENKEDYATCLLLMGALSSYGPYVRDWLNSGTNHLFCVSKNLLRNLVVVYPSVSCFARMLQIRGIWRCRAAETLPRARYLQSHC